MRRMRDSITIDRVVVRGLAIRSLEPGVLQGAIEGALATELRHARLADGRRVATLATVDARALGGDVGSVASAVAGGIVQAIARDGRG